MRRHRRKEQRQSAYRGVEKGGEERREEKGGNIGEPRSSPRARRRSPASALTSVRLMLYLNLEDGELEHATVGVTTRFVAAGGEDRDVR
jgi:hypothetical protein